MCITESENRISENRMNHRISENRMNQKTEYALTCILPGMHKLGCRQNILKW